MGEYFQDFFDAQSNSDNKEVNRLKENYLYTLAVVLDKKCSDADKILVDFIKWINLDCVSITRDLTISNIINVAFNVDFSTYIHVWSYKDMISEVSNGVYGHDFNVWLETNIPNAPQGWRDNIYNQAVFESSEIGMKLVPHGKWQNSLRFRSKAEVVIYEELLKEDILFFPLPYGIMKNNSESQNKEPDFLCCYRGKWGILEIQSKKYHNVEYDTERSEWFKQHNADSYPVLDEKCLARPQEVVTGFIRWLKNR
ncbi:hypothetical protein ACVBAX_06280 [Robertmurraya sp. GLU-23]